MFSGLASAPYLIPSFASKRVITILSKRNSLRLLCVTLTAAACCNWSAVPAQAKAVTTTSLAVTASGAPATSVSSGTVVTLTAAVQSTGAPVTVGQVNFCDATAAHCTDIHVLGTAQLTSTGAASFKFRPGIGNHSLKAVFMGTNGNGGSASIASALAVTGTLGVLASTTTVAESGSWGNYALMTTVTETGNTAPPTGTVSFLDTNHGNAVFGTGTLGGATRGVAWTSVSTSAPSLAGVTYAVADLNGDGIPDLFVENYFGTYDVFLGNGDGTFTEKGSAFGPNSETGGFILGDFNNDGIPDVAAIDSSYYAPNSTITIFLGNGDGTFTVAGSTPALGYNPTAIATADINGDGNTDLIVVQQGSSSSSSGQVVIFFGNGEGAFTQAPTTTSLPSVVGSVVPADLNDDGHVDLVVGGSGGGGVTVLLGKGDGTFNSLAGPSQAGEATVAVADVNNDGFPDLVFGAANTSYLTVFLGNGDGTFTETPSSSNTSLVVGNSVAIADLNQDGIPDVVYSNSNGITGVLFGKGDGTFVQFPTTLSFDTNGFGTAFVVADFNGDGWPDVLAIDGSGRTIADSLTEPTETATASAADSIAAAGPHLVDASYRGDSNYDASTSGTVSLWGFPPATTTTLAMTSGGVPVTSVAPGTQVLLTASVNAGASPVTTGQVNFCDASVNECSDIHLLGTAALSSSGTATLKFVPGAGVHSYKAVLVQNGYGLSSSSAALTLTVGPAPSPVYTDTTAIALSGSPGAYSLTATVLGYGGPAPPTGNVSFLDTSFGNTTLATATLGPATAGLGWLTSQTPAVADAPIAELSGDFNGDGIPDLALLWSGSICCGPASVTILFGNGDGTFTAGPTTQVTSSQQFSIMTSGDFNGDGKMDLAVLGWSSFNTSTATVLLGDGDGTFGTQITSTAININQGNVGGGGVQGTLIPGDFNGDGKLDLAAVGTYLTSNGASRGGVSILLGNGDGTFAAPITNLSSSPDLGLIATGDFNGDGIPDIIATNYSQFGGSPIVFLGKGDGTLTAVPMSMTLDYFPTSIVVGDFNGDGVLDVGFSDLNGVEIALGNGDGTFKETAASPIAVPDELTDLALGDFNHDGKLDIAGIDNSNGFAGIVLLTGAGDGTFTVTATPISTIQNSITPAAIVAADFNSDGVPDLAILTKNATAASILLTEPTQTATATVNSIAPVGAGTHNVDASYSGDSNYSASVSTTTALTAGVAPPVISPSAGTFNSAQSITITDTTPGATIYYSASYNQPPGLIFASGYVPYTGPIPLEGSGTLTISAYATETGYRESLYSSATYTLNFPSAAATPVFSSPPGEYPSSQTLTITDSTPGATIYYTTNGTYANTNSNIYSGPITVSNSEIITAKALAPGYSNSAYVTGQYYIASSSTRFIYTIAGTQTYGYAGEGGPATFAELNGDGLQGVAVDSSGNVYMTDSQDNVVRKVTAGTGIISTIAGTGVAGHTGDDGPAASAELLAPSSIAVDGNGNLFIGETGDDVVRRIDALTGTITTYAGNPTGTGSLGGPANNFLLSYFTALACDSSGDLYIAEGNNVLEVNAGTGIITGIPGFSTGAGFGFLDGIAVDSRQNIYVSDESYNVVRMVNPQGVVSVFAGSLYGAFGGDGGPATSARLSGPAGLAVDGAGNVYIADSGNEAIREVNVSGIINTVAGILGNFGGIGGDGSVATDVGLFYPQIIAADAAGDIYFAEEDTSSVRKITAPVTPPSTAAAAPVFSLAAGTYPGAQTLTMTDVTPGAEIYVTLNGNAPTTNNQGYHGPINITGSVTVQAIAVAPGYLSSTPASATYIISAPPTALISTVAGDHTYGFLGAGGPAISASMRTPQAVAFDGSGSLYIADSANNVVWMVSASTGDISIVAGTGTSGNGADGGPATATALNNPSGVAIDKVGNLYISDTNNGRIRMVAAQTGLITTIAGPGVPGTLGDGGPATSAYIESPHGIAFDEKGDLYIADGSFFVANAYTGLVRMIAANTGMITTVAGGGTQAILGDGGLATAAYLGYPEDVAFDGAGSLYILDGQSERIRKVNASTGIITTIAGNGIAGTSGDGGLATAASINLEQGIAVDGLGNVYFSNEGVSSIRMVNAVTGIVTTIGGDGYFGYGGDGGAAAMAELYNPQGLALDITGNLYISDFDNYVVRKVSFPGPATAPVFSLTAGAYHSTQTVTITDSIQGATIYYTTDGSTPSTTSPVYNGSIMVSATETLQAIAVASGYTESPVTSAQYSISPLIVPVITWTTPAAIAYGTPLSTTQLDATTTVAGTFAYSPIAGAVPGAGAQTLSVTFTPTDTADYTTATASVTLTVNKVTPSMSVLPSALSITTTQPLNVTVSIGASGSGMTPSGTVVLSGGGYNSPTATLSGGSATLGISAGLLAAGTDTLTASYTPDSNSSPNYNSSSASTTVAVTAAPSFALSPSEATLSVVQGSNSTDTVTVTGANGFTGSVTLSTSGLPSGVTASFGTNPATGSSVLTLTATGSATVGGPTTVTIGGTSGSLTASTTVAVTVTAAPTFVVGGGSSSLSIEPGATTGNTVAIAVTPSNGFTGAVSLTCSITPAAASDPPTCTLSPSSVTVAGTGAQASTLTIFTTPSTSSKNEVRKLLWPSAGISLALLFFRIPRRRRNWLAMLGVLAFVVSFGAIGCGGGGNNSGGGGGGGGGGNSGTTPGTYTVTVTGSSGNITGTVGTVTLTVQ